MFGEGVVKHQKTSLQKSSKGHGIAAVFDIQMTFQILRSNGFGSMGITIPFQRELDQGLNEEPEYCNNYF